MARILILFAHPRLERSRTNIALIGQLPKHPDISFRDLYELYPDFNIDVETEKTLLLEHDIIIWHHPVFWYSCPPLLKQWIDMVLEFGWAYGPGGTALSGKIVFNVVTSGGSREAYSEAGHNRFTMKQYLVPFDQTARVCKMHYLPPFLVQGTHRLDQKLLADLTRQYQNLLLKLQAGEYDLESWKQLDSLNLITQPVNE